MQCSSFMGKKVNFLIRPRDVTGIPAVVLAFWLTFQKQLYIAGNRCETLAAAVDRVWDTHSAPRDDARDIELQKGLSLQTRRANQDSRILLPSPQRCVRQAGK